MALDRTFNDGRVQTANVGISSCTVEKYNMRFNVHIQHKTNFIFPTLETRRDSRDGVSDQRGRPQSLTQAAPNELQLGKGGKVVRAGHRLGGGVGG